MVVQVAFRHKLTLLLLSINTLFAFDREKIIQDFEKVREHYRKEKRRPPIHSDDSRHRRELFDPVESEPLLADSFGGTPGFYHSVASGDPLPDAVIIWTRYTPVNTSNVITLHFRMAVVNGTDEHTQNQDDADLLNPDINAAVVQGTVEVDAEADWIAKIDVTGLQSNSQYVFAFIEDTTLETSDVGITRTAPAKDDKVTELTYAVFSCARFEQGYFHPYDIASTIRDLDLWIHVGDFIYEDRIFGQKSERVQGILPLWETITLQDYRLRYATYIQLDEGLRNLRRRAPMMASWDDHETANNAWVNGASNHQPTCPVDQTDTLDEMEDAMCDQDEGPIERRWRAAFQAYMEWLPLRFQEGSQGLIEGSFTQIIEWGNLATVITFDSRTSYRSEDPTVGRNSLDSFEELVMEYKSYRLYDNPATRTGKAVRRRAETIQEQFRDPSFEMIGEFYINLLNETFQASAEAGKPWQIYAANVMMGPHIGTDPVEVPKQISARKVIRRISMTMFMKLALRATPLLRALHAMAVYDTSVNRDGFDGFHVERAKILDIAQNTANNMIVLGGDVHDSYAFSLYEGGELRGEPVAVNLVCTGVTSIGPGSTTVDALSAAPFVSRVEVQRAVEEATIKQIPGLKFLNYYEKGFYAVKATPTKHVAELILVSAETTWTKYDDARLESGGITANFFCPASLTTTAGEKGSLDVSSDCDAIAFAEQRSSLLDLDVPVATRRSLRENKGARHRLRHRGFKGCRYVL